MTYEQALALKQAGFPQKGERAFNPITKQIIDFRDKQRPIENDPIDPVYIPTLEELIEECGDDFKDLRKHDPLDFSLSGFILAHGSYSASMYDRDPSTYKNTMFGGKTAIEAVANLYLALKNK